MEEFGAAAKHQSAFRETCNENFDTDGSAVISIIFNPDESALATRTIFLSATDPHMTIDFQSNGQRYELKETPKAGAEIFTDGLDKDGNRLLTKIDSSSDEYKNAKSVAEKLGFDTLPSCTIV